MIDRPGHWQRIRLQDVPAVPWRNGGGLTHELLAWPGPQWRWRISVARIDRDGPFSHYPQVHRQFAVIRGAGVRLNIDGMDHELRSSAQVLSFDGEQDCQCSLIDGPTLDFNLMSRATTVRLQRWPAPALPWTHGQLAGIYACAAAQVLGAAGQSWRLAPDELLWTEHLPEGPWQVLGSDALVFGALGARP